MKYGIMLPSRGPLARPDSLSAIAQRAEELGYQAMMFPDHIVLPRQTDSQYPYSESGIFPGTDNNETMEQLTTLAFLAGQTKSIRLVTSVMVVPHRSPVVTAKVLSTIDVLSKGRMTVGVGAGWLREEFEALQTPPFGERGI
jgi:alkanesulfonate monooxygenase SsuD/methylene tetrahydromethanopterin reductase-like flavin-dependent oxidoreductase (luciferase family)